MKVARPLRVAPLRVAAVALIAVVGLSACASTPSAKRVALDSVETLDVSDAVKTCMRDAIDNFDQDELQEIAELADEGDADGRAELARFEATLRACRAAS